MIRNFASFLLISFVSCLAFGQPVYAQTANWIWHPEQTQGQVPVGDCYFRKTVEFKGKRSVLLKVAANDKYDVFLNGQLAAVGESTQIRTFDVSSAAKEGKNILAVKVSNTSGTTAGFAAALMVKQHGSDQWKIFATDSTWRTQTRVNSFWKKSVYNDSSWKLAKILTAGKTTNSKPNDSTTANSTKSDDAKSDQLAPKSLTSKFASQKKEVESKENQGPKFEDKIDPKLEKVKDYKSQISSRKSSTKRGAGSLEPRSQNENKPAIVQKATAIENRSLKAKLPRMLVAGSQGQNKGLKDTVWIEKGFEVQKILDGKHGSFIAMTFNEFGQTILSCEGKGLILVDFTERDQSRRVRKLADSIKNVQGILPINGALFVTGSGPQGSALYRLEDQDRDGYFESSTVLLQFEGKGGEHGPHGMRLGPDGKIYLAVGNASQSKTSPSEKSPYKIAYTGDMKKTYEDPGGHALGIDPPGGTILRISLDGKSVETFAGGLRNVYDLEFNIHGDLFVHDSDMEGDDGTPWYRPANIFHVIAGADMGWRRGWSKWPAYFMDAAKPLAETGNGSPTGITCYRHATFPIRFQDCMFSADWLKGRIDCISLNPSGASYSAKVEKFFEADGMPITDLEVGPDGAIYFCTGGRGTEGGIFRIQWNGSSPDNILEVQNEVAQIVRMPQVQSSWALQQRALLRQKMGERWDEAVYGITDESRNKTSFRLNAMSAMFLFGPRPGLDQLVRWASDDDPAVRRAAIGLFPTLSTKNAPESQKQQIEKTLIEKLSDKNGAVRRCACETMLKMGISCDIKKLTHMLKSDDWAESLAARSLAEAMPSNDWKEICFNTNNQQLFCQLALALLRVEPSKKNAYRLLVRISEFTKGEIYDREFLSMLRISQLAVLRCEIEPTKIAGFGELIAAEFPSQNGAINRELARLLAILDYSQIETELNQYFEVSSDPVIDKLSVAMHLQTMGKKFESDDRFALLQMLESQKDRKPAGSSYPHYLSSMTRDLVRTMDPSELDRVLESGDKWQNGALEVIFRTKEWTDTRIQKLIEIDRALVGANDSASTKLKLAIIAILSEKNSTAANDYLRKIWRRDKERRSDVTIGLAQNPGGKNWPYLVTSIPQVDDDCAIEILNRLATVDRRPSEPKYFKTVLEVGYKLRHQGAVKAAKLLQHWTEEKIEVPGESWKQSLDVWKNWFETTYPDHAPITVYSTVKVGKWSQQHLLDSLDAKKSIGDLKHGRMAFAKANCASCHRFEGDGEMMGPDLTLVAKRFSDREILESILEPSKHISSQYAAKVVTTHSGEQIVGIVTRDRNGHVIVLDRDGKKRKIARNEVDEIVDSKVSAMPNNLLDHLSEKEIMDLFALLRSSRSSSRTANQSGAKVR